MDTEKSVTAYGRRRIRVVVIMVAAIFAAFVLRDYLFDVDQFRATSRVLSPASVGWAGIGWDAASPADIATMGVPCALRLTQVAATGPGDTAGLVAGDFVTTINGATFQDVAEFQSKTSAFQPGQKITLGVIRNGVPITVTVTLGNWSDVKDLDITAIGL